MLNHILASPLIVSRDSYIFILFATAYTLRTDFARTPPGPRALPLGWCFPRPFALTPLGFPTKVTFPGLVLLHFFLVTRLGVRSLHATHRLAHVQDIVRSLPKDATHHPGDRRFLHPAGRHG